MVQLVEQSVMMIEGTHAWAWVREKQNQREYRLFEARLSSHLRTESPCFRWVSELCLPGGPPRLSYHLRHLPSVLPCQRNGRKYSWNSSPSPSHLSQILQSVQQRLQPVPVDVQDVLRFDSFRWRLDLQGILLELGQNGARMTQILCHMC